MLAQNVITPRGAAAVRKLQPAPTESFLSNRIDSCGRQALVSTAIAAKSLRYFFEFVQFALLAPMKRHMDRKAALHALTGFTDHNLRDIGLARSDVSTLAAGIEPRPGAAVPLDAPELPPQRPAYRPGRRGALGSNAAAAASTSGRRRMRASVPITRPRRSC